MPGHLQTPSLPRDNICESTAIALPSHTLNSEVVGGRRRYLDSLNRKPLIVNEDSREIFLIEGRDREEPIMYGQLAVYLKRLHKRHGMNHIAEFYGLVIPELRNAQHQFLGIERDLCSDGEHGLGDLVLVSSWKPKYGVIWSGGAQGSVKAVPPPENSVFVVLSRPNNTGKYASVVRWVNRWNWVPEDDALAGAPKNWLDRYSEKV